MDNAQRVTETIVSETGKTYEDASLAEIGYAGNAFGFWAKEGPHYLADESVKSSQVLVKGKKLILRYRPLGLIGVIGPWNVLIAARVVSGSTCEVSGCLSGVWPSRKQALTPRGVTLTLYTDLRYWLSASGCQLLDLTMFSPGPPRCSLL